MLPRVAWQLVFLLRRETVKEEEMKVKTITRFLITTDKPEIGEYCKGRETLENGQTNIIRTPVVKYLKKIMTGKYVMKTMDETTFLVDVVKLL